MARSSQTWKLTPTRRDPRGLFHLSAAAGTLAAAPGMMVLIPWLGLTAPTRLVQSILGAIFLIGVLWALLALWLLRRRFDQTVTVGPDAVEIVAAPMSPVHTRRLPFGRITSIEAPWGRQPGLAIFADGFGLPVTIGGKDADPVVLAELADAIRAGIAGLPDGPARLDRLDAKARAASGLAGRIPVATLVTELLLMVCFGLQWAASCVPLKQSCDAIALANVPEAVAAGEVYRLVTANLLHADALHFGLNLLALAVCGNVTELALGWRRTTLLYLAGGVVPQIAAATFTRTTTVGASGIVYVCLGALLWLSLRRGNELPGRLRLVHVAWPMVGLGLLLELAIPRISSTIHIAGFLVGFALTPLMIGKRPLFVR